MKLHGEQAWLDQLSVLERWQRRGLGRSLIERTARQAAQLGFEFLHLSTYRDVPWNGPYYTRCGFAEVPRGNWPRAMRQQIQRGNSQGHPSWHRIVMQRAVSTSSALLP
jgi:N-acetylglutamate synthase-like GNAT family acetyltransferase